MSVPRLFRIPEAAEHIGYERRSLERWIAQGRLRAVRVGPQAQWRIREDDLQMFIESMDTNEPTYRPVQRRRLKATG